MYETNDDLMQLLERNRDIATEINTMDCDDFVDGATLFVPGTFDERQARWAFTH